MGSSSNIQGETTFGHVAQVALPIIGGIVGSLFGGVGAPIGAAAGSALGNVVARQTAHGDSGGMAASGTTGSGTMSNPFGGGKGGSGGSSGGGGGYTNLSPIAGQELDYGQAVLSTGLKEFLAGASGQLTPAQQALSDYELGQTNTRTNTTFGNLGMGPGTGLSQDLNANLLGNEALQADLERQSQDEGLKALGTGLDFDKAASAILRGQNTDFLSALKSAASGKGNKSGQSAGSSTGGGAGSSTGGGAAGTVANAVSGGAGSGFVDSGSFDLGSVVSGGDAGLSSGATGTGITDLFSSLGVSDALSGFGSGAGGDAAGKATTALAAA